MMKEKNKKYTATDFVRYHSGSMSPVEMRALEQAALDDPFLAEALDGYAWSEDHYKELKEIERRLQSKQKSTRIISGSFSSGIYWKIAAMIVLIAGAGYIFYLVNDYKVRTLASVQEDTTVKTPSPFLKKTPDTISEYTDLGSGIKKKKDQNAVIQKPSSSKPKKLSPKEIENEESKYILRQNAQLEEDLRKEKLETASLKIERSKELRIDTPEKIVPDYADTTLAFHQSSKNYIADSGNEIALQKENAQLREVVVTGYGQKRKSLSKPESQAVLKGKVSGVDVQNNGPFPEGGRAAFDQYLIDSAQTITDSAGRRLTGNILLEFIINKKGKPADISVLQSDCKPCEKEAIRLLEQGPRWVGVRRNKTSVWIKL